MWELYKSMPPGVVRPYISQPFKRYHMYNVRFIVNVLQMTNNHS